MFISPEDFPFQNSPKVLLKFSTCVGLCWSFPKHHTAPIYAPLSRKLFFLIFTLKRVCIFFCQFNNLFLVVDAIFDHITEFCCEGGRGLVEPGQSSATDPVEIRWCKSPGIWKKALSPDNYTLEGVIISKVIILPLNAIIDPLISPNIAIGHLSPFGKVKMKPPCLLPPCQCPSIMFPLENVWNWGLYTIAG